MAEETLKFYDAAGRLNELDALEVEDVLVLAERRADGGWWYSIGDGGWFDGPAVVWDRTGALARARLSYIRMKRVLPENLVHRDGMAWPDSHRPWVVRGHALRSEAWEHLTSRGYAVDPGGIAEDGAAYRIDVGAGGGEYDQWIWRNGRSHWYVLSLPQGSGLDAPMGKTFSEVFGEVLEEMEVE